MINDTPRLAIRRSPANPNHHLWLNNGVWWCHVTLKPSATGSVRKRFSLKTHSLEAAKNKRDRILTALRTTHFAL